MKQTGTLTVIISMAVGIFGQTLASHLKIPAIILLLFLGVSIGPDGLGLIDPSRLGNLLATIVGFAVAVILFEGGLQLEVRRLRRQATVIQRLIGSGAIITAVLASLTCYYIMGWEWQICLLFGTLVIVTGPTVVTPLLRRIKANRRLHTILEAEGVLIDPVGAIIAVAALDFVIGSQATDAFWDTMLFLISTLAFGFLAGVAGGFLIGYSLKLNKLIPRDLENMYTLALVILLFEVCNQVLHESGIMAVTVAGIIVGNMKLPATHRLLHFKEQLTIMLIGFLFVLLAADIRMVDVIALGWPGIGVVLSLIFIVRPINVLWSARGSRLSWNERLFMCWLAPRGIVAAAVASLFAFDLSRAEIGGGTEMRALVFLVIASTVVMQGLSAGPIASLLKVRRKSNWGYVIIGANQVSRVLAKILSFNKEDVVLVDSNSASFYEASEEGFRVIYGNALEESVLMRAGIDVRRSVIASTPNNDLNIMALKRTKDFDHNIRVCIATQRNSHVDEKVVKSMEARTLFGCRTDFNLWLHRISQGTAVVWKLRTEQGAKFKLSSDNIADGPNNDRSVLFLAAKPKGYWEPAFDGMEIGENQELFALVYTDLTEENVLDWLAEYKISRLEATKIDDLKLVSPESDH
ncbi:cation:proton antiporter [Pseudobacteriovorax antillogorgiicola]|uniref:Sodium/proton antiporter, CPA1 family n=1 Tax=Pseudobacteriovorax antillogorgiicola TaxID=1513793 RepID=A0A1Y6BDX8_9BACT|nr:cation:proton antiporter [Pseudobacteriovorax antillogorgiicola]TCS57570.1 sodium/proton antiporter (CPA1 family) [Pseudobacteriovorax antillogorgiicola]SME99708.1 sodium/proton antiporter, CPA1 family [Pseudobacteriovorax antillogorgiicola]